MTGDLVKWLGTPPTIAAGMARKTTDGHNWYGSIPRDLARNNPRDFFAIVFWSDQCRDWDASVDVASGDVLRIKMKAIAEAEVNRAAYARAAGLKIFRIGLQNLSGDGRLVIETWGCVKCLAKASQTTTESYTRCRFESHLSGR